ncbi:hypothetical protein VTK56DRAFT_7614 [Thermocarpiscus australiensis]
MPSMKLANDRRTEEQIWQVEHWGKFEKWKKSKSRTSTFAITGHIARVVKKHRNDAYSLDFLVFEVHARVHKALDFEPLQCETQPPMLSGQPVVDWDDLHTRLEQEENYGRHRLTEYDPPRLATLGSATSKGNFKTAADKCKEASNESLIKEEPKESAAWKGNVERTVAVAHHLSQFEASVAEAQGTPGAYEALVEEAEWRLHAMRLFHAVDYEDCVTAIGRFATVLVRGLFSKGLTWEHPLVGWIEDVEERLREPSERMAQVVKDRHKYERR